MLTITLTKTKKALLAGFALGFLALFLVHLLVPRHDGVHYHANFAVYVDGQRETFDSFSYYEEIQGCDPTSGVRPQSRAHMHNFVNDTVHVHDDGVTWGHFFANLGFTLGNDVLSTDDGVFVADDTAELTFILNGQEASAIANELIQDQDVLLINYGTEADDEMMDRFDAIERSAADYNQTDDPGSCAGDGEQSFWDRVVRALGIPQHN